MAALTAAGRTLAVAESVTAGLVCGRVADVPGASAVLRGGLVAYATDLKADLLGVDPALLAERGAVDPDVAAAMARGVRQRLGADIGVATTGVAGPAEQDGAPPGTVFVAVATAAGEQVELHRFAGGRAAVRAAAVDAAVAAVLRCLARP